MLSIDAGRRKTPFVGIHDVMSPLRGQTPR
jgi:hypothetical protein